MSAVYLQFNEEPAERKHGKSLKEAVYQACLMHFQADHDYDDDGVVRRPSSALGTGSKLICPLGITI
jgi:hypothetical protein